MGWEGSTTEVPARHRLLCQVVPEDGHDEYEARQWLIRTFGPKKGSGAVLHPGIWFHRQQHSGIGRVFDKHRGFRAYLPL